MRPYLDIGFLISALVNCPGTAEAWKALRRFAAPDGLTRFHRLQLENAVLRQLTEGGKAAEQVAYAWRDWQNYVAEGVFAFETGKWDAAVRLALLWNRKLDRQTPHVYLLLHPGLAVAGRSTHFLGVDPRSRELARAAGLEVWPEAV